MKIYMGPYTTWIGPYQIAEKILFWKDKYKDDSVHALGDWLAESKWLVAACQWIENKKSRKVKIRIDKYDTWSMENTLSQIILPMLIQLNATKHGAPYVEDKDVPKELRSTNAGPKENEWDTDSNHFKRWEWVMNEMIWTFEQLNDDNNDAQFHSGESEILWQALDKDHTPIGEPEDFKSRTKHEGVVTYQMVKGPNDTSAYDAKSHKKHGARIAAGLMLF
jgi:hypothetical protein